MYILKEGISVRGWVQGRGPGWDTFHGQTHATENFTFATPLADGKNEVCLYDIDQWTPISPCCMETMCSLGLVLPGDVNTRTLINGTFMIDTTTTISLKT